MTSPQYFTVKEIAAQLRVSQRTIRDLLAKRLLACVRVGGCVRISDAHLDAYLASRETGVRQPHPPRVRGLRLRRRGSREVAASADA